tara:strand:+ start:108 stop:629 length:522 start_codon:yes stop_codon:yes gene_type:complete
MIFNQLNEHHNSYTIRGQFEDERFSQPVYGQELYMLAELDSKTINNGTYTRDDPDVSYALEFNHVNGHDGRFPIMAQMRDWFGLSKKTSQTWLLTKELGGTSTLHTDVLVDQERHIVFCTDWQPGQAWYIEDQTYTGWKTGTVLDLNFELLHGNGNSSHTPMTFMQVTSKIKA